VNHILAKLYDKLGNYQYAKYHLEQSISIPEARYTLAQLHFKTSHFEEAKMHLEILIEDKNTSIELKQNSAMKLGKLLLKEGDYHAAKDIYLKAKDFGCDDQVHYMLGMLYQNDLNDPSQAKEHFIKIADIDARANYALGVLYQNYFNKPNLAKQHYNQAINLQNNYPDVYYAMGYLQQEAFHDKISALKLYHKAVQMDPRFYEAHYAMGLIYQEMEFYEKARMCYSKVVYYCPTHASGQLALGLLLSEQLKLRCEANAHYAAAVKVLRNPDVHYAYGLLLENEFNLYRDARREFEACLNLEPNYVDANYALALLLKTKFKEFDLAKHYYYRTIEIDSKYVRAYQALGILLKNQFQDMESAKLMYEKAIELDPNRSNSYYAYGILLAAELQQQQEGIECFIKCLELDPSNTTCWQYMVDLINREPLVTNEKFDSLRESCKLVDQEEGIAEFLELSFDDQALKWSNLEQCAKARAEFLFPTEVETIKSNVLRRNKILKIETSHIFPDDIAFLVCKTLLGGMKREKVENHENSLKKEYEQTMLKTHPMNWF